MTLHNLNFPILQPPVGGIASTRLAANGSNARGMESLAPTRAEAESAPPQISLA